MWQIDQYVDVYLPRGYSLWEDVNFLFLYFRKEEIVVFSSCGGTIEEIAKEIRKHQQILRPNIIQFSQSKRKQEYST